MQFQWNRHGDGYVNSSIAEDYIQEEGLGESVVRGYCGKSEDIEEIRYR